MRIQDKFKKPVPTATATATSTTTTTTTTNTNNTIHSCAESGDLMGLHTLLNEDPSRLYERSIFMVQTPLHVSAAHNKFEIVQYLLDWRGPGEVELEAKNLYGETPLHLAAKNCCNEAARMLLNHNAYVDAKTNNGLTPLHLSVGYALTSGDYSMVKTLFDYNADCLAEDYGGLTPLGYIPEIPENEELRGLFYQKFEEQRYRHSNEDERSGINATMDELDKELSKIVGLHELKVQLRKWAKGVLLDEKRRAMGLNIGPRKRPHMAFLGNPGTGKTTVARILGKLLHSVGVLPSDSITEVQRSDLVGEYIGQTGPKTRKKIEEATGGILFVDEAYRLMPQHKPDTLDLGLEALEEIMSVMEDGEIVIIFAGYTEPMKRVIASNAGFSRRVTNFFDFDDFSCKDLAEMLHIKMTKQNEGSRFCGFKLHPLCTLEAVTALIEKESTEKLRNKMNGGLVDHMLTNAKENLDSRLSFDSKGDELITITYNDLEAGLKLLSSRVSVD